MSVLVLRVLSANLEIKGGSEPFAIYDANDEKKLRTYTQSNGTVLALTDGANAEFDIIRLDGRTTSPNDSYFNGGNVGIGTTSPGATLHVKAKDDSEDAIAFWVVNKAHNNSIISAYENGYVQIGQFTYDDATGNVGIGVGGLTPEGKLEIAHSGSWGNPSIHLRGSHPTIKFNDTSSDET